MPLTRTRRAFRIGLITTAIGAASMLLAACGGGGSSKSTPTPHATSTPGAAGAAPTAAGDASSDATPTVAATQPAADTNSGDLSDFKALANKFADSKFNATYQVTGSSDPTNNGALRLVKDGRDRFRFEISGNTAGQDVEVTFIENPDVSALCLTGSQGLGALLGIEDGQGACFKSDPTDTTNPLGGLSDSLKSFEDSNVTILGRSTKTVAGQDGTCFRTEQNDGTQAISTSCFNSDGVILYVANEGADASVLEAQTISGTVNDSDFVPPYELRDFPTSLGGDSSTP